MNGVSCQSLKNRRPHGFHSDSKVGRVAPRAPFWFLLSILLVLGAITSSRAQTPTTNTTTVITNNDDLLQITNGGAFTFATNGTFTISNVINIRSNTIIDATGLNVILTGIYTNRLFYITNANATLTLINLEITGGKSAQGAAIYNNLGTLYASNVMFAGNRATNGPGKNGANGSGSSINGTAGGSGAIAQGGAIYSNKGLLILTNCTFTNNIALGGNGGNGGNGFSGLGGNGGDGGQGGGAFGGAIFSTGTNRITGCYFVANATFAGSGGGGGSSGSGPVSGSTGAGGQGATAAGGAVYIPTGSGGVLNVTNSTFAANEAYAGDSGPQSITAGGLSSNGKTGGTALGGAVENFGTFYTENSTFFENTCRGGKGGDTLGDPNHSAGAGGPAYGGAVCNAATFAARNCTFATNNVIGGTNGVSPFANRNGTTGAIFGGNLDLYSGTSKITNCILQHGLGPDNSGKLTDGGYNISSDASCAFTSTNSLSKTNALLSSTFSFYPGYPPVLELIGGNAIATNNSPAIDLIPPIPFEAPTNFPPTDERGYSRLPGLRADAGAFEFVATAPRILVQPVEAFADTHDNASFSVSATGAAPLAFQWQYLQTNGTVVIIPYGTNSSLTITNVQATNYGSYSVVITNGLGSTTSSNALLSPVVAPSFVGARPFDVETNFGATVVFSVGVSGDPLSYQWFLGTTALTDQGNYSGTQTADLTIASVTSTNSGSYKLTVTNSGGTISTTVQLTVDDPAIVTQPADATVNYGGTATFTVGVSSSTTNVTFQWLQGTNKIANQTKASYTNLNSKVSTNFSVVVSNANAGASGVITSRVATLTVLNPAITSPPTNLIADLGSTAIFTATAIGSPTLKYQWTHNGASIPLKTNSSLTISPVAAGDAGTYTLVVTNANGIAVSPAAILTVNGSASISGQVTFGTNGVQGITITNGVTNVVSGADGSYLFSHLTNGTYIVGPKQIGSGLTPGSTNIVIDGTNPTNIINFAFNAPHLEITSVPTSNTVPVSILSAPLQGSRLQSSLDLTNWTAAAAFITDTNGTTNIIVTVTNTIAPDFFLRAISP